jgi:hypothetical protein
MNVTKKDDDVPREQRIGAHTIRFEPPDLCVTSIVGDLSGEEMVEIVQVVAKFCLDRPTVFSITDMSRMGVMSAEAKKHLRDMRSFDGLAILGASVQLRVVMQILSKAYFVLNRKSVPMVFVTSVEEARALVDTWRRQHTTTT